MFRKTLLALVLTASGLVHAQIPISGLPNATTPLGANDKIVVNQLVSGTVYSTRQAPLSALAPFFPSINSHYILQAPDPLLPQSRTLVGTANQVIVADGGALGNLTLSLPQSICITCGPTFSSLTLNGLLNGFSGVFSSTLQAASLSLTTPLQATSGGTGFGAYAVGDLLAASTTTALSKLSDVAAGSYLRSGGVGTLPLWSTLTLPNAATTGDVLIATGTNAIGNLADVTAGSYLRSNGAGATPVYSTVKIPNTAVLGDIWVGSSANNITALAGNITSGVQFLAQTGTGTVSASPVWTTLPGGFTGFANPSGLIGLTAVNGVATTATRSDATHALDQSISPTMTGNWVFSPTTSATDFTVNNNSTAASTTMKVASTFSSASTTPLLSLISTATTPFATLSLSANGTVGTDDLSIFQNGASNRDVTILNRAAAGALNLGAGGSNRVGIASGGAVTVNAPASGTALTVNGLASTAIAAFSNASSGADNLSLTSTNSSFTGMSYGVSTGHTFSVRASTTGFFLADATGARNPISFDNNGSVTVAGITTAVPFNVGDPATGSVIANFGTTSGSGQNSLVVNTNSTGNPGLEANASGTQAVVLMANASASAFLGILSGHDGIGTVTANRSFDIAKAGTVVLSFNTTNVPALPTIANQNVAALGSACVFAGGQLAYNNVGTCLSSSRRYKKDIEPLDAGLDEVMRMRPVSYEMKVDPANVGRQIGLIAEEVREVEPRLTPLDPEGKPYTVEYQQMTGLLVKAIQEQQQEIKAGGFEGMQSMHRQLQTLWACILLLASWNAYLTFRRK